MKYRFICIAICSLFFSLCAAQNQLGYVADSTAKRLQIKTVSRMYTSDDHTFVDDTVTEVYNKEGLIVSSGSISSWYDYYYYNDKNQLVKDSVFDPFQGAVNYYFYREDGRLKKSVNMNDEGIPGDTTYWIYFTTNGKITGAESYLKPEKGNVYGITDYKYGPFGVTERAYNNYREVYEYSKNGLLGRELTYLNDKISSRVRTYTYYPNKLLKEKVYTYDDGEEKMIETTTYEYNDMGLLVKEINIIKYISPKAKPANRCNTYTYTFY